MNNCWNCKYEPKNIYRDEPEELNRLLQNNIRCLKKPSPLDQKASYDAEGTPQCWALFNPKELVLRSALSYSAGIL
jgi:hypothetical protein